MSPPGETNLGQIFPGIVPGAVGPVTHPGIDTLIDPITQQSLQITVHMIVGHQAKTAHVAFEVDDKFLVEPQAEADPKKGSTYWLL